MRFYAVKVKDDFESIENEIIDSDGSLGLYCPKFKFLFNTIDYSDVMTFCHKCLGMFIPTFGTSSNREILEEFLRIFNNVLDENPDIEFHYKDDYREINFNTDYINLLFDYFKSVYINNGIVIVEYDIYTFLKDLKIDDVYTAGKSYLVQTYDMLGNYVQYCCLLKKKTENILEFVRINPNIESKITSFTVNLSYKYNKVIPLCEDKELDSLNVF